MPDLPRLTATLVRDKRSGEMFLQGREEFTPRLANVFGNGKFKPVRQHFDKQIVFEAEVSYRYSEHADDDVTDCSEVYGFRIWGWSVTPDGPEASLSLSGGWEYFQGDYPPGAEYGWDALLYEAVEQLREARIAQRHNKTLPVRLVGGLPAPTDLIDKRRLVIFIELFVPEYPEDHSDEDDRWLDLCVCYSNGQAVEHEAASLFALIDGLIYGGYDCEWFRVAPTIVHCFPTKTREAFYPKQNK